MAPSDVQNSIEIAVAHHRAGRINEAELIYRAILKENPSHSVALNLLGVVASQTGHHDQAVVLIEKSIHSNPENVDAYVNLGNAYIELDQLEKAVASFNQAVSLNPNLAMIHANMSVPLRKLGRIEEACKAARKALTLEPDLIEAHNNLGNALKEQEKWQEALEALGKALELDPNHVSTLNNLGNVHKDMNEPEEAFKCYTRALEINPVNTEALNNLGILHQERGDLDEAIVILEKAIAEKPNYAEAHNNLGIALQKNGNRPDAIKHYREAIKHKPDYVDAVFNLSFSLLLEGNLKEGLEYYEWRWRDPKNRSRWRDFPQPLWDGSDISGKRLLVWGEQGIGDEIVYASLYRELIARGADCIFECQERLVPLFQRSFPEAQVVARTNPADPRLLDASIDFQCPAASITRWLLASFEEGPDRENYLKADPQKVKALRAKYTNNSTDKIVGLGWWTQNSKLKQTYNIPIEDFDRVLKTPGVVFVNLQYGDHSEEIEAVYQRTGVRILQDDEIDPLKNMDDFAALEGSMDLVISIVSSTSVLASGLGVPVWGLLPEFTEWRWGNDSDHCLWYPSMRLFRQGKRGENAQLGEDLKQALEEWLSASQISYASTQTPEVTGHSDASSLPSSKGGASRQDRLQTGVDHHRAGRLYEAEKIYREILKENPNEPIALNLLGSIAHQNGQYQAAYSLQSRSLELAPDNMDTRVNLANTLKQLGRFEDAIVLYRQVLQTLPDQSETLNNLGSALLETNQHEEAISCFRKAIQQAPELASAYNNLGLAHLELRDLETSKSFFRKALSLDSDYIQAEANLAMALLMSGDFTEGYAHYALWWHNPKGTTNWRDFTPPHWDGSDLSGKTILVWGEQGLGDEVVFSSLFPTLIDRGASCIFECHPQLVSLFRRSFPEATVVARTSPPAPETQNPDIDFQCPSSALMSKLMPSFDAGPNREAFLKVDPDKQATLRARYLSGSVKKVVGLAWETKHKWLKNRMNFPTDILDSLLKTPNVQFVNLQYGDQTSEIERMRQRTGVRVLQDPDVDPLADFDAYAAQLASMDLVVSIVNSTAVTTSSIGTPVWGILPYHSEWRWGNKGDYCLWYPSMRVFRPQSPGDWSSLTPSLHQAFQDWADRSD